MVGCRLFDPCPVPGLTLSGCRFEVFDVEFIV